MIEKIFVHQFRKFENIEVPLGKKLTIIAGKNGTQKTTLLGILGHPFSMSAKNDFANFTTLAGTKFQSKMTGKFKFSPQHDIPGTHRWDIYFDDPAVYDGVYPVSSMPRGGESTAIRFWHAKDRSAGSGYIQLPVIFLSLQRLFPMGEANHTPFSYNLTDNEAEFFHQYYKEVLISRENLNNPGIMLAPNKKTLAAGTDTYDEHVISAGQDNIGQILMAILSFRRLKSKFPQEYKGGLLLIDELDATLYPASQEKLVQKLYRFASDFQLQIIATTHSMNILRCARQNIDTRNSLDTKILYLRTRNTGITVDINPTIPEMENHLRVEASKPEVGEKIHIYCEDKVGMTLLKSILGQRINRHVTYIDVNIGAKQLIDLIKRKVPEFMNSIIVLDGDMKNTNNNVNVVILPGKKDKDFPEKMVYRYLDSLPDDDPFWSQTIGGYDKEVCFRDCLDISSGQDSIKVWYKTQSKLYWGRGCSKVLNRWKKDNADEVGRVREEFITAYNTLAQKMGLDII